MNKLTAEEVKETYKHSLTLKSLREFVENNKNLDDDTKILIERIEDKYFLDHNWDVHLIEGEIYNSTLEMNENMRKEIKLRESGGKPEYDRIDDPKKYMYPEEHLDDIKEQFYPAQCITKNKDFILIYSHY